MPLTYNLFTSRINIESVCTCNECPLGAERTLLNAFLRLQLKPGTIALLDDRFLVLACLSPSIRLVLINPSILGRLKAERLLVANVQIYDSVLCFGNPPTFERGRTHRCFYTE